MPKRTIARRGRPIWQFDRSFDPSNRAEVAQAIRDLAHVVRDAAPRRYFPLDLPNEVEHAIRVTAKGRTLRLIRFFNMRLGAMEVRLSVAGA